MATAVDCGADRLRDIRGECCDLCGDVCHPDAEICVAISCGRCEPLLYHQGCIEKYLKKHGFEMNRKTGFPCPRGRGKATRFPDECKGRVDKSHPIIPRNEEKKKKSLAPPINEVMAKQVKQKPDPKAKQQQQAKPPAIPRKAKPIAQQAAATVLRSGAPLRTATPPAGNVWQQAGASSAVRQAPTADDHAAASAAALAAAAELEKPKGPHVPVGLVLEEALTKAQKKNLQRRKKKQQQDAGGGDACSESGTAITDASSVDGWNDGAGSSSNAGAGSSLGTTAGAAALLSSNSFVTDIKRYQQLLGLYVGGDDSDDEDAELSEDVGDDSASDVSSAAAPAALTGPSSSLSNASTPAALPDAGSSGEHAAAAASDADDAALAAIMEQSRREYELQQEMQRQRDILSGYGAGSAFGSSAATTEQLLEQPASPPPVVLPAFSVPIAQPVVVPAAVPVTVPVAEPVPALGSFAGLGFQQQPAQPLWQQQAAVKSSTLNNAAGYGGYGVQQAAAFGMVPMAAGHGMATAAAAGGEEDDDLDSLLALCGVAG